MGGVYGESDAARRPAPPAGVVGSAWPDLTLLADLPVLPLEVRARARDPIFLPEHAGSSLRGAFGNTLRSLVCIQRERSACAGCPEEGRCAYPALFEPRADTGRAGTVGFTDLPRPYLFRAPPGVGEVAVGDAFSWHAALVGRAACHLPHAVLTWRAMGETGMGRGRGRFGLLEVDALDAAGEPGARVYDGATGLFSPPGDGWTGTDLLTAAAPAPAGPMELTIEFRTPTSLKWAGRVAERPEFHILWRAVQRRLSMLRLVYGGGRLDLDFRGAIAAAEGVKLLEWQANRVDWTRAPQRQGRRVPMSGWVGTARYRGVLQPALPALLLGSRVGVGDNCAFGQGWYRVNW